MTTQDIEREIAVRRIRRIWLLSVIAVFAIAVGTMASNYLWRAFFPIDFPETLRSASRVDVETFKGDHHVLALTDDPAVIKAWLPEGPWQEKKPCACVRSEVLIFHTPQGDFRVWLTDHDMGLQETGKYRRRAAAFVLPPGFWMQYQSLLAQAQQKAAAAPMTALDPESAKQ